MREKMLEMEKVQVGNNFGTRHYPYQAILDNFIFQQQPDIARWDLFIPFKQEDVEPELITHRKIIQKPIPDDIFIRHVHWAFSRGTNNICYEEEVKNLIKEKSAEFINVYGFSGLSIVNNGFREVLSRFSVAYACLYHSVDNSHENVVVKKKHVEKAIEYLKKVYGVLRLKEYKEIMEGDKDIGKSEIEEIIKEFGDTELGILNAVKISSKSSSQLNGGVRLFRDNH